MPLIVKIFGSALMNIGMRILMNAAGEKQLAKILFAVLAYFAAKTATDKDDKLVAWAKELYAEPEALEQDVSTFVLNQQNEPLQRPPGGQ